MRVNTIRDLAAVVRGRRQELGLSQAKLASRVGVSRDWVNYFEGGKATVELGLVLRVLDALQLQLDVAESLSGGDAGGVDLDALLDEHRRQ